MNIHEIGKGYYYVKTAEAAFHRNIYIKRFEGGDGATATMIFDPGAKPDAALVYDAVVEVAGSVADVDIIFVSHQDPDVTGNAKFLADSAPRGVVMCSVDAWRLVKLIGIPDNRFYLLANADDEALRIRETAHLLRPVPAYYCHFRGSMMLYEPESRVLFSGDLFGGVNTRKGPGIYADDASWEGISLFHQIYMPSRRAVAAALTRIAALDPPPEVIAPQHGDVIAGPYVAEFTRRLGALDVGVDLEDGDGAASRRALKALAVFFDDLERTFPDICEKVWAELVRPGDFTTPIFVKGREVTGFKTSVRNVVVYLCQLMEKSVPGERRDNVVLMLTVALEENGVPVPSYCLGTPGARADLLAIVD